MGKAFDIINKINETYEVNLTCKLSNSELDAIIESELKNITRREIREANQDILEASDFPQEDKIKSMKALLKKQRGLSQAKSQTLVKISNKYQQAKDRSAKIAATKERKKVQAEKDKIMSVINRAQAQLDKLLDAKKKFNKNKKKAA